MQTSPEVLILTSSDWLFATEDQWLERRRTRDDDEFNDQRLLQRDILRFDADIRGMLGALWDLVDADDSGQVGRRRIVTLSVNLQRAVTDDFDLEEATKIAKSEFEFDAQGHETMDRTLFFWSFFQLACVRGVPSCGAPSLRRRDSFPSDEVVGGFFFEFEAIRN